MLNVQAMTQTMSAMSLPQLQQYASLHKDDPYTVALALSIANQKKQAMTAQQGQAGMQPMPKVVDQALEQMSPRQAPMPEEVGIGQLPAPNIAKMAGGGIVAFGDGGEIPRYRDEGLVQGQYYIDPITGQKVPVKVSEGLFNEEKLRRLKQAGGELWDKYMGMFATPEEKASRAWALKDGSAQPAQPAMAMGDNLGATDASLGAAGVAAMANAAPQAPTAKPPTSLATSPAAPPQRPTPTPGAASQNAGLQSLITTPEGMQKALADMQKGITPKVPEAIASGISDVTKAEQAAADKVVSDIEAEQKARGPALKEFEARVKEKEGRLSKQEEMQGPLALLQAGFAIMGGTSPFAFANIGAGAQVGLKSYVEGAEKLEAARDKLADSYGKIEEVRRNESRMDSKELREARNAALKPAIDAKKLTLSALEKDWGLSRQEASKGLETIMANQRELFSQTEQTRRTGMQIQAQKDIAAMPPAEARTAMLLGTGKTDTEKLESGMRKMAEISQEKGSAAFAKLYATHLDESNKQGVQPMSPDAYAASLQKFVGAMLPRVTSTLPSNAPVRTQ